jgi:hypothetical protein
MPIGARIAIIPILWKLGEKFILSFVANVLLEL